MHVPFADSRYSNKAVTHECILVNILLEQSPHSLFIVNRDPISEACGTYEVGDPTLVLYKKLFSKVFE